MRDIEKKLPLKQLCYGDEYNAIFFRLCSRVPNAKYALFPSMVCLYYVPNRFSPGAPGSFSVVTLHVLYLLLEN
jgi:hypothetical protein